MSVKIKGTICANDDKWIYDWFEYDATSPKDIEKGIQEETEDEIVIEINSGGGDVFAGNEIYYIIKNSKKKTRCSIVGLAASAATIAACGADVVDAVPGAQYMIHNVASTQQGDYNAMDKASAILQNANRAISNIYRLKTGMTEKELLELMNAETWMDSKKAMEYGFIDEVIGDKGGVLKGTLYNGVVNIISNEVKEKIRNMIKNPGLAGDKNPDFLIQQKQLKLLKMKGALK